MCVGAHFGKRFGYHEGMRSRNLRIAKEQKTLTTRKFRGCMRGAAVYHFLVNEW